MATVQHCQRQHPITIEAVADPPRSLQPFPVDRDAFVPQFRDDPSPRRQRRQPLGSQPKPLQHQQGFVSAVAGDEVDDGFEIIGGCGFRTRAPRGGATLTEAAIAQAVDAFLASVKYYRLRIDELHTKAFGDVVVAWSFHTEDFQVRSRAPELVQVRFSATLMKTADKWVGLIGHRDAQPFDARGQYLPGDAAS